MDELTVPGAILYGTEGDLLLPDLGAYGQGGAALTDQTFVLIAHIRCMTRLQA